MASSLITAAESVTVCEYFSVPFERVLGPNVSPHTDDRNAKFFFFRIKSIVIGS